MLLAAGADLDEQAAVIELARHNIYIVVPQEDPEALGAPPRHLHSVLHACSAARAEASACSSKHPRRSQT